MVCEPDDDDMTKPYAFHFPHNVAGIDMDSFAIIDKVSRAGNEVIRGVNDIYILVHVFRN